MAGDVGNAHVVIQSLHFGELIVQDALLVARVQAVIQLRYDGFRGMEQVSVLNGEENASAESRVNLLQ